METKTIPELRVLLLKEGASWCAQCIEYDIAAQGHSLREAKEAFERQYCATVALAVHYKETPLEGIPPAPEWFAARFNDAEELKLRLPLIPFGPQLLDQPCRAEARLAVLIY